MNTQLLVQVLDFMGTAVFALSGAAVGVKHRLDIFGVGVLAASAYASSPFDAGGPCPHRPIASCDRTAYNGWRAGRFMDVYLATNRR